MAFMASTGLYIFHLENGDLTKLSEEPLFGTIDWIP
jgi:hypothetical protein